jgi:methionyl aminopeptidase
VITVKSPRELDLMARAGRIVGATLALVATRTRAGLSTADLDAIAEAFIRSHQGATPSFKGLYGYPATLCTSINHEVVHGIPSRSRVLRDGDIVSVDVGACVGGFHADSAITVPVGAIRPEAAALLRTTQEALDAGIAAVHPGAQVGDIGDAVQRVAEDAGYSVVRELVGHGIGSAFHEEPQIPNFGPPRKGARLVAGMTLAIEPMINRGRRDIRTLPDKWTVVTVDGSLSAHFEHTVVVTEDGARILTERPAA